MYMRALQGYEKALGPDNITTYTPALNTLWGLGSLLTRQADFGQARIMYSKALAGYEKVVGPDHPKCQSLRENLQDLDAEIHNSQELSHLESERALLISRRHRLFKRLGLR
jgi:hypothetical protein